MGRSENLRKNEETTEFKVEGILIRIPFPRMALATVSLPGGSLAFCFISAVLFMHEQVNDTECKVDNFIPSISAVTGAIPGRYVWRTCIGLHSMPRFLVAVIYYNYYMSLIKNVSPDRQTLFKVLVRLNFWLNTIENGCLVGVTVVSNKENYPVHEKIFILFMVTGLCYMLLNTILFAWTRGGEWNAVDLRSYKEKKLFFISIMLATMGLLFFFFKHRLYCEPYAFSYFSLCEFIIAYTNMGYHYSARYEFGKREWVTAIPIGPDNNLNNHVKSS